MRVRIRRRPRGTVDGIALDRYHAGLVYEVGTQLAALLLAEGWGEPAALVLVVDDHDDLRQLAASVLKSNGYDVIEALDGQDAIASLCRHAPDLVLLDLNMPIMNGWEFRAAQQQLPDEDLAAIPVVVVTEADDPGDHAAALKAAGLVKKPFNPEQLLEAVERVLPH